jgi:NAD(P)-dependent dehydrogenase (short-subunit alcohol dehydrogenase family)
MKLTGKRAVVTGASQGLGQSIATLFAKEGADVLVCARSAGDLKLAEERIGTEARGKVAAKVASIASELDVRALVEYTEETLGGLDVLVCNAGIYGPKGPIDELDWTSWVEAIQINLLGTVLCCRLFLPLLRKSPRGKIILLSGGGATKPLPFLSAYAASKAGVVRFGETLAGEVAESGIDVNSVAPGALNTRMLQEILDAGPEKVGAAFYRASIAQREKGGTPLDTGANLCLYLASDESNGITGKLISAAWDPWREFAEHRQDLDKTDVYTLRRIIPAERGLSWGS